MRAGEGPVRPLPHSLGHKDEGGGPAAAKPGDMQGWGDEVLGGLGRLSQCGWGLHNVLQDHREGMRAGGGGGVKMCNRGRAPAPVPGCLPPPPAQPRGAAGSSCGRPSGGPATDRRWWVPAGAPRPAPPDSCHMCHAGCAGRVPARPWPAPATRLQSSPGQAQPHGGERQVEWPKWRWGCLDGGFRAGAAAAHPRQLLHRNVATSEAPEEAPAPRHWRHQHVAMPHVEG